ncbi:MAG: SCO family protein [Deltaproteobacteria bacterium]|nr:SCO family protein [Deltaproteobacteria bacterium]
MTSEPSPSSPDASSPTSTRQPPWKNPFVIAFVAGAITLTVLPFLASQTLRAPPAVASLGPWQLVDQDGKAIGSETLRGQVWIASVFFSRCPSVCPKQQRAFASILRHVDDLRAPGKQPVRLVSFSVDPGFDSPEVLRAWATKQGVDLSRWSLVTGPEADLKKLLVERMFLEIGDKTPVPGTDLFDIAHASRFVLVDQNGDVRGYWPTDDLGRGNLINAARLLWKKGPRP